MKESDEESDLFLISNDRDRKIPKFLHVTLIVLVVWGIWALYAYKDGAKGWPNRGLWRKLQEAAKTTKRIDN